MQGAAKRLVEKKEFGELDTDGDGIVSQKELDSALVDMNVEGTDAEQAKQEILQHVDKDGDGIISRAEFQSAKADVSKESAQTDAANEQSEKKLVVRSILSSSYSDAAKRLLQAKNFQQMDQAGPTQRVSFWNWKFNCLLELCSNTPNATPKPFNHKP